MQTSILSLVLACSLATAAADHPPLPSTITYFLGGAVSGPYRLTVDLETDRLSEAKPPPGVRGDGAQMSAADLPVTARRALTPAERNMFRTLAAPVWRDGAARRGCFKFSMDALVQFAIVVGGMERRSDAPAQCLTTDAVTLRQALLCAASPGIGCS